MLVASPQVIFIYLNIDLLIEIFCCCCCENKDEPNKFNNENFTYLKKIIQEKQIQDFVNELEKPDFNLKRLENEAHLQEYAKENEKSTESFINQLTKTVKTYDTNNKNLVFYI